MGFEWEPNEEPRVLDVLDAGEVWGEVGRDLRLDIGGPVDEWVSDWVRR